VKGNDEESSPLPGGMRTILDEYRADVEALLEEHKRDAKNCRYNLNYGDLSVTDVWYRVDYEGDVTLVADISEGDDWRLGSWMAAKLSEKWSEKNYLVEVKTSW
jgi:hypothetical protein